jgi:hypothetical protein
MANTLRGEGRAGQASLRSTGGIPVLDETYHFLVEAASKDTSRIDVLLNTPGLPLVGQTVSAFGFSVCRSVSAVKRPEQAKLWDVTAEFSSEVDERQGGASGGQDPQSDPETWVPVYETKFERLQEVATKDRDGDAIANSAGQPFETGIIRARYIPIWEFFQFEPATVTDEQVIERNETVNNATFRGRAANTLLCTVMSSVIGFYYGSPRRLTQYSLRYNSQDWLHKRLDVGTVYLSAGDLLPYEDESGNVILGALNGSGGKQAAGTAPSVLSFAMFSAVDFSAFLRI